MGQLAAPRRPSAARRRRPARPAAAPRILRCVASIWAISTPMSADHCNVVMRLSMLHRPVMRSPVWPVVGQLVLSPRPGRARRWRRRRWARAPDHEHLLRHQRFAGHGGIGQHDAQAHHAGAVLGAEDLAEPPAARAARWAGALAGLLHRRLVGREHDALAPQAPRSACTKAARAAGSSAPGCREQLLGVGVGQPVQQGAAALGAAAPPTSSKHQRRRIRRGQLEPGRRRGQSRETVGAVAARAGRTARQQGGEQQAKPWRCTCRLCPSPLPLPRGARATGCRYALLWEGRGEAWRPSLRHVIYQAKNASTPDL